MLLQCGESAAVCSGRRRFTVSQEIVPITINSLVNSAERYISQCCVVSEALMNPSITLKGVVTRELREGNEIIY